MKAPSCTLCGASHWGREPHVFGDVKVRPDVRRVMGSIGPARVTVGEYSNRTKVAPTGQPKAQPDTRCQACGKSMPARAHGGGRAQRFCSDACRKRASRT